MFKLADKVAFGALAVIVITNPASGQVILDGLDVMFKLIFQFGSPINFVASGVLIVYIFYKMWTGREKVTVKPKGKKKSPVYLET